MGVLTPVSAHAGPSAQPPIGTSGNFPAHMSAESISPNFPIFQSKSAFWGAGGVPEIFSLIGILIFLLPRSPCKISKLYHKPFLENQPILAFVRPKSAFLGG